MISWSQCLSCISLTLLKWKLLFHKRSLIIERLFFFVSFVDTFNTHLMKHTVALKTNACWLREHAKSSSAHLKVLHNSEHHLHSRGSFVQVKCFRMDCVYNLDPPTEAEKQLGLSGNMWLPTFLQTPIIHTIHWCFQLKLTL